MIDKNKRIKSLKIPHLKFTVVATKKNNYSLFIFLSDKFWKKRTEKKNMGDRSPSPPVDRRMSSLRRRYDSVLSLIQEKLK